MKRELKKIIILFIIVFALFAAAVVVSEEINYRHIINTYPENVQTAVKNVVSIPMPSQKAFEFQRSKVTTWLISLFLGFVVPGFFLFSKLSQTIRNWAVKKVKGWALVIIVYFLIYSLIEMLIYFPLDMYTGFVRMHYYGLSNQTFMQWLIEML